MKQVFAKIDEDGSGAIDLREVSMKACDSLRPLRSRTVSVWLWFPVPLSLSFGTLRWQIKTILVELGATDLDEVSRGSQPSTPRRDASRTEAHT